MKKLLSIITLTVILVIVCFAVRISADTGKCGETLEWSFSHATLIFSGTGDMYDYEDYKDVPWYNLKKEIKFLIIPNTVTSIGSNAFRNCGGLIDITIPDSITYIGDYAFEDCYGINELEIPDSVTHIGYAAFHGAGLRKLVMGESVETVGGDAFYDSCRDDFELYITDLSKWCSIEFAAERSNPIQYADKLIISGETVTNSIVIPNGVTRLGSYAFYGCDQIESISIPASVKEIGSTPFIYCNNLKNISVDKGNNDYLSLDGVLYSKDMTKLIQYPSAKGNTEYIIPDGVLFINEYAFANCMDIRTVKIPDSVIEISDDVFRWCVSLTDLYVGRSLRSIGGSAIYYCESLTNVYISDIAAWCSIDFCGRGLLNDANLYLSGELVTHLVIPDNVTKITDWAFFGCESIVSLSIGDSVQEIGNGAFRYSNLSNIDIGNNVTKIGINAFSYNYIDEYMLNCSDFFEVAGYTVKDGTKLIADGVFNVCECSNQWGCVFAPHYVTIPRSVEFIGENKFEDMYIRCCKGSYAHRYAVANGIEYELIHGFDDVSGESWYADSVEYVFRKGYMKGMSEIKFSPNSNITREQFVLILANMSGVDTVKYKETFSGFSDVKTGRWYSGAITWAAKEGCISGISETKFGIGQPIQRAALVRMLYNYANKFGMNTKGRAVLEDFGDFDIFETEGGKWMKEPMQWAVDAGIISGMNIEGKLCINPKGYTTRAQAARILMQFDAK